jgi:TIR domain
VNRGKEYPVADVFLSFIHEQQSVAVAVQKLLQDNLKRHKVFLSADVWQVLAGENWLDRIKEELSSAKVVILLLSKLSVDRPWVNFEAGAAWLSNKPIIPACFGGVSKEGLPKPYSSIQALNLAEDGYYLVRSVFHYLNWDGLEGLVPPPFSPEYPFLGKLQEETAKWE